MNRRDEPGGIVPGSRACPPRPASAEFVVVQDTYPTKTTCLADLVVPAAQWGEKTGTMTNPKRRVSIVEKVVEPPGEARPGWEIFAGVARRLGFEVRALPGRLRWKSTRITRSLPAAHR